LQNYFPMGKTPAEDVIPPGQEDREAMKIQKLKDNRILMTVLQGLLLLTILSTLFSVCIGLMTGFSAEVNALNEKLAARQAAVTEGKEQETNVSREALNEASASLEKYRDNAKTLKLMAVILYTAFALLFLLRAWITRDNWRLNLYRYGVGCLFFAACAVIFLFTDSAKAYIPVAVLHVSALIVDHVFSVIRNHKVRNVIPRALSILVLLFIVVCAFALGGSIALLYLLLLTVPRIFYYIAQIVFSRIKMDVLRKIVRKTYAAEILFGMLLLMIAFSIVLPQYDPGVPSFEDALWYCFAIVTTIGFGDFTAVTFLGRVVSVILGIYGIIVVALITSIIVNFYNETRITADPDETEETEETETAEKADEKNRREKRR